jgi:hypothetical protein
LVLAPAVALFGTALPDRFVCVLLAALNGLGFFTLLGALDRHGGLPVPPVARVVLTLFFLFGTVHFYLAMTGNPWELAHIVCNGLVIAALHLALRRHWLAAAAVWAAVLWTRHHVFLAAPALLGLYWMLEGRAGRDTRSRLRGLVPVLALWTAAVALLLAFNQARFDDPLETGISHHLMHEGFRERFERYGYFDLAYLPRNAHALLLAAPELTDSPPWIRLSPTGMSLFLTSPLYLYLFASLRRPHRTLALWLWAGVLPVLVPILLLMGTGELQFGHRYSSDVQVLLVLLTYLGMGPHPGRVAWALLALSIGINAWGAAWFVSGFSQ